MGISQQVFLIFFAVFYGAILRVAQEWFPFTPTFTSEKGKWLGQPDIKRILFSGIFLFLAPAIYFLLVFIALSQTPPPINIPTCLPSFIDLISFLILMSLIAPPFGFYDIWQAIVRRLPEKFYSKYACEQIERKFPNAFKAGCFETFKHGLFWVLVPSFAFLVKYWFTRR